MKEPRSKKASSSEPAIPGVEFGQLEKLLDFMALHGLEEFEYEHGGLRIRLKKASAVGSPPRPSAAPQSLATQPASSMPAPPATEIGSPASAPATAEDLHMIQSPIVGTFYSAPSPGAPPFVKPGDIIQAGQVVCIVEAMKLMNEIEADVSGEVVRMLIENGQPVEYGQSLFAIRTKKK
jgi:acetyl-CoA carboxylase biotin carboxyl carrier protein